MGTPPEENKPNITNEPAMSAGQTERDFFISNLGNIIAYVLITLGLIYSFFDPFVGEVPVGFILGLYCSAHIFHLVAQFREFLIQEGFFRGFIIIAAIAAMVIAAPGLCLGLVGGTLARTFFGSSEQ
jgi:hypothetical protein